ncbi:MAG TPA: hypothetical protein DD808_07165 [Halieaceae bacterium]|nr:hypothetical protein [Halieaceae bacterium]
MLRRILLNLLPNQSQNSLKMLPILCLRLSIEKNWLLALVAVYMMFESGCIMERGYLGWSCTIYKKMGFAHFD